MSLIKFKQRVADHGEVFTPEWMVEAMLDLVKDETERINTRFLAACRTWGVESENRPQRGQFLPDSQAHSPAMGQEGGEKWTAAVDLQPALPKSDRLLEPACGSGNFLVRVLQRKLATVELKFGKSDFEKRHYPLLALMCIYGIELLADSIEECRANMLEILASDLNLEESDDQYRGAAYVLSQNLLLGDALTMRVGDGQPITFAEWGYLGKGKFQRRDFRFDVLTGSSAFSAEGSLFAHLGKHEIFTPTKSYAPMTVGELAAGFVQVGLAPLPKEEA